MRIAAYLILLSAFLMSTGCTVDPDAFDSVELGADRGLNWRDGAGTEYWDSRSADLQLRSDLVFDVRDDDDDDDDDDSTPVGDDDDDSTPEGDDDDSTPVGDDDDDDSTPEGDDDDDSEPEGDDDDSEPEGDDDDGTDEDIAFTQINAGQDGDRRSPLLGPARRCP